jgi:hypothetical protein
VSVCVLLGAFPLDQGSGEDAHRASSTSRTASCTTFMRSTCCFRSRAPSM